MHKVPFNKPISQAGCDAQGVIQQAHPTDLHQPDLRAQANKRKPLNKVQAAVARCQEPPESWRREADQFRLPLEVALYRWGESVTSSTCIQQ